MKPFRYYGTWLDLEINVVIYSHSARQEDYWRGRERVRGERCAVAGLKRHQPGARLERLGHTRCGGNTVASARLGLRGSEAKKILLQADPKTDDLTPL